LKTKDQQRKLLESEDGLFDNYTSILSQFKDNIEWRKVDGDKWTPWPKQGIDEDIDKLLEKITTTKNTLKDYIVNVRKKFNSAKISYAHNHKYVTKLIL
jgi:hypothetical protein